MTNSSNDRQPPTPAECSLRRYLTIVSSIPSSVNWFAIAVDDQVLLVDARKESTTLILEGIASKYGEVIASHVHEGTPATGGAEWIGCLIVPNDDAETVAGKLRFLYNDNTSDSNDDPSDTGPF